MWVELGNEMGQSAKGKEISQRMHTIWGYLASSVTLMSCSLMLRNWSTLCSVPRMHTSFLSSTTISRPIRVLKKE